MTAERFRACVAVYGVLIRDDRVLLLRRAGSGYRDGELSLPAGHLDGDEDAVSAMCRELREELGIEVGRDSCTLRSVLHRRRESESDHEYIDLIFEVSAWSGAPSIAEPEKCKELVWVDPQHLPHDVVDYIAVALRALQAGRTLVTLGWER